MQKAEQISNRKRRGEWAEMYFMTCASERGLHISRPYGDSDHFDFIVGDRGCLLRVQVKSTLSQFMKGYGCNVRATQSRRYTPDDYDFLAVLVIPRQVWYIIPAALATRRTKLLLSPDLPHAKYAPYKDAWHLLRTRHCFLRSTIAHIEACADVGPYAGCGRRRRGKNEAPAIGQGSIDAVRQTTPLLDLWPSASRDL